MKFTYLKCYRHITLYEGNNLLITFNDPWFLPGSFKFYYGKGNYTTCLSYMGLTILWDNGKNLNEIQN